MSPRHSPHLISVQCRPLKEKICQLNSKRFGSWFLGNYRCPMNRCINSKSGWKIDQYSTKDTAEAWAVHVCAYTVRKRGGVEVKRQWGKPGFWLVGSTGNWKQLALEFLKIPDYPYSINSCNSPWEDSCMSITAAHLKEEHLRMLTALFKNAEG